MRPPADAEWLRTAFLQASPEELARQVDAERVWLAATGALPADERRAVIDEVATDPATAQAWRLAHRLLEEAGIAGMELEGAARQPTRGRWAWAAAAAGLLLALGLAALRLGNEEEPPIYRGEEVTIAPAIDPAPTCSPDACRFAWTPVPGAVSYRLTILTEDLVPLFEVEGLEASEMRVPEERLGELLRERAILWQVEARLAGDERVVSPTFRLETLRRP
jgi:hypothetical protein